MLLNWLQSNVCRCTTSTTTNGTIDANTCTVAVQRTSTGSTGSSTVLCCVDSTVPYCCAVWTVPSTSTTVRVADDTATATTDKHRTTEQWYSTQ